MFVTYTPEGQGQQEWNFRPGQVRASRTSMLEKLYAKLAGSAQTYEQFKVAVQQGSSPARRVLLWHLQSLDHPTLRIEDVDYAEDELVVEFSLAELQEMRGQIETAKGIDDDQREQMLGAIDTQMATAKDDGKSTFDQRRERYWLAIANTFYIGPRQLDELTIDEFDQACAEVDRINVEAEKAKNK